MKNSVWAKAKTAIIFLGLIFVFAQIFSVELSAQKRRKTPSRIAKKKTPPKPVAAAQSNLPKVTQIDTPALKNLLKREGENAKPLLINFWATWCEPCREEFPDLVKIDADYKGKIDFITISLDYLSEIDGDVPKFLAQMKAEMPAYLLKTENENEAIAMVSKDWQGALPFTILFDASGREIYVRQGKIKVEAVRAEIDKVVAPMAENKDRTKTETNTNESKFFNKKPLEDFGARFGEAILKNEVNLNAPFAVEISSQLGENGKLIKPVASIKPGGDEKMSEFAKEFISALSDSQLLGYLYELGSRNLRITLEQDENNLKAAIRNETESENRAKTAAAGLNMMAKFSKSEEGSTEAVLLSKTQITSEGKSFTVNFLIPHDEKKALITRSLTRLRDRSKNN
jgi:thiol-disulfide isomerase/thioredoxin